MDIGLHVEVGGSLESGADGGAGVGHDDVEGVASAMGHEADVGAGAFFTFVADAMFTGVVDERGEDLDDLWPDIGCAQVLVSEVVLELVGCFLGLAGAVANFALAPDPEGVLERVMSPALVQAGPGRCWPNTAYLRRATSRR